MSNWLAHVKKTMKSNPGKALKDVLKLAKSTYTKGTAAVSKAVRASVKSAKKTTRSVRKTLKVGGKKHKKTSKVGGKKTYKSKTMKRGRKQKGGEAGDYNMSVNKAANDTYRKLMKGESVSEEEKANLRAEIYRTEIGDSDYSDTMIDQMPDKLRAIFRSS
jgi:hypothetical protein